MKKRLHVKGWKAEEVAHAEKVLAKAESSKHPHIRSVEFSLFWFTVMTGVLGSSSLALISIPILIAASSHQAAFIIMTFGFLLGLLILYISRRMHWLTHHHHASITFGVAVAGVLSFALVAVRVNEFNLSRGIVSWHQPFILGFLYFVGFLAPYSIFSIIHHVKLVRRSGA